MKSSMASAGSENRRHCITIGVVVLFATSLLVQSCFHEEITKVSIDFSYTIRNEDHTTPAQLTIENLTTGAENYLWTFEGGVPATSTERNPGTITFAEAGEHVITLEAWNLDDRKNKTDTLTVYDKMYVDFSVDILTNNISPVTVKLTNKTLNGTAFYWEFENGNPSSFTGFDPPEVVFVTPGEHHIMLRVQNGPAADTLIHSVTVTQSLTPDFEIVPSFNDEDYEAPLHATLVNNSVGGLQWQWSASGGVINKPTAQQPDIDFSDAGMHTVTLQVSNGKETKMVTKTITVKPNTGLRTLSNIKLGINTGHSVTGSFYSTELRRVIKKNDPDSLFKYVDLAFFGLNANFTFNRFVSPDSVQNYTFDKIEQPQVTHFINSQELCVCVDPFTESEFDQLVTDDAFKFLDIKSRKNGVKPFDGQLPRIVLFATDDNRKGAIKIKEFHSDGFQSYIVVDIKVQKK
jgi:PKD repeat protein